MGKARKYKRLIESLGCEYFFYSHDLEGKYLYISPSVESVLGYTVEEAFEGIVKHMTDSELNRKTIETLKKSASGEKQKTFEFELFTKNRKIKVIEITESPLLNKKGKLISIEGVAHDITERKQQEKLIKNQYIELQARDEELQQNLGKLLTTNEFNNKLKKEVEDRQNLFINLLNEIYEKIYVKDDKGKFLIANIPVAANFGLTPEELIGKSDFDLYPKEEAEQYFNKEKEILKSGNAVSYEEGDINIMDGRIVKSTKKPFKIEYLNVTGLLGIQIDITEIRKSEAKLQKLNEELQVHEEELSQNLKEMTATKAKLEETVQNLQETQSQLIHSEKMGALGHLIAGIAHEINTPIGAIQASIGNISISLDSSMQNLFRLFTKLSKKELIIFLRIMRLMEKNKPSLTSKEKREFKKEIRLKLTATKIDNAYSISEIIMYLNLYEEIDLLIPLLDVDNPEFILKSIKDIYSVRKNSENIKLAVDKASKVIFALKIFTHKDQGGETEKANLIDNIETVLTLLHNQLKQGINVIKDFEEIPLICCFPDELVQVWINLISNAIQAMDNQGTLTITVKNSDNNIQISIKDTGCGIANEIRDKIFDPFFTTKKAGEGTGIGLGLVRKIIDKHHATLNFKSKIGVGTTFIITLPIN